MLHPVIARQGQVGGVIRAAMLLGNDVVNMEGRERLLRLRDPAIFTAVARTLAHQAARCRVDHAGVWLNNRRALACSTLLQHTDEFNGRHGRFILRAFLRRQLPFGAFVRQLFKAGLYVGRGMEVNQMPSHVGREAIPDWRQQPLKERGRW